MYNSIGYTFHGYCNTRSMPKIQDSTEERVTHYFRVRLQGEMTFELDFERQSSGRWGSSGMVNSISRGSEVAQRGLFGDLEAVCYLRSTKQKERGDVRTVLRGQALETSTQWPEGWLHPHGQGAGQAFHTFPPVLSASGISEHLSESALGFGSTTKSFSISIRYLSDGQLPWSPQLTDEVKWA